MILDLTLRTVKMRQKADRREFEPLVSAHVFNRHRYFRPKHCVLHKSSEASEARDRQKNAGLCYGTGECPENAVGLRAKVTSINSCSLFFAPNDNTNPYQQ